MLLVPAAAQPLRLRKRLLSVLLYLVALGLPYLPVAGWAIPLWLQGYQTGFEFVPLPEIYKTLASVWTAGVFPVFALSSAPLLLAVISGALLWIVARGRGGWRLISMLLAWVLLPPLEIYIVSLGTPIFVDRYLIWAMPGFLALASLGVVALVRAWRPLGLLALGAIVAVSLAGTAVQQTRPLKSDFRAAAGYVMSHRQPGDRLIFQIPYNRYLFEYYSGPLANAADGPYTNAGMSEAQVGTLMADITRDSSDVWLIESEASLWDQRGLTQWWLGGHGQIVDRADFTLVQVVRYRLGSR
jgi:hypothetical protein